MHEALARELVRALRGKRSQPALCRRIGLRSNLVYRWEAGRAWPTASQFFRIGRVVGIPIKERLELVLGSTTKVRPLELETLAGTSVLLRTLAGSRRVSELAARLDRSRFIVSRWLSGKTAIRLPDLLRFVEVTTLRLPDFVAVFVDPSLLPSTASHWARLQAARAAAYDVPWSHAVLRTLELDASVKPDAVKSAWIAERLGIPESEVNRSLTLLVQSGQVRRRRGVLRVVKSEVVDTSADLARRNALRNFWSRVAVERLARGVPGVHAFNLFTIAEGDVPKLRELHLDFFNRLRALASESSPSERVVLYAGQIVPLDE
jgi:transcriptional regulator with XRE-family HTH domain